MGAIRLHSKVAGPASAKPLLLLNGLGTTMGMWDPELDWLTRRYRVIRCDPRGHGQSPCPPAPYTMDDLVADALRVLDEHDIPRATVLGLSMGGMTALGLGLSSPDRVERIICVAARAEATPPFVENWTNRLALLDSGGLEAVWHATVETWLSPRTRQERPGVEAVLKAAFLETQPEGYRGCASALCELDYLRSLNQMSASVAFIAGELDRAAPPSVMRDMAAAAPRATYVEIKGSAHMVNQDQPDSWSPAIRNCLDEISIS